MLFISSLGLHAGASYNELKKNEIVKWRNFDVYDSDDGTVENVSGEDIIKLHKRDRNLFYNLRDSSFLYAFGKVYPKGIYRIPTCNEYFIVRGYGLVYIHDGQKFYRTSSSGLLLGCEPIFKGSEYYIKSFEYRVPVYMDCISDISMSTLKRLILTGGFEGWLKDVLRRDRYIMI